VCGALIFATICDEELAFINSVLTFLPLEDFGTVVFIRPIHQSAISNVGVIYTTDPIYLDIDACNLNDE
jgi:hypothetical protein